MTLSRFSMSDREGGLLDGLKARLGFAEEEPTSRQAGASRARSSRSARSYEDDFDYGDSPEYADEFAEYGPDYDEDEHDPTYGSYSVTTPRARAAAAAAARTGGSTASNDFPRLVSIDDVRASSRRSATSSSASSSQRTFVKTSAPSYASPRSLAQRDVDVRSSALNSLFPPASASEDPVVPPSSQVASAGSPAAYDPYKAYEDSAASASHAPARSLSVLKPVGYGDVERIAKTLKSGDVVVIVLRNTPDDLAKRILDFSFGVASALDASVECPGDKVFALTRGAALGAAERQALRNQGVL